MGHVLQFPCHHFSNFSSSSSMLSHLFPSTINGISSVVEFRRRKSHLGVPAPHRIMTSVKCMANPRRVAMVAKQIRREVSDVLLTDKNLQYAVLPEAALGADRYLSSVTTISDVEVSADLQDSSILSLSVTVLKPMEAANIEKNE